MNIKINSEAELIQVTRELIHIIVNMRDAQKNWHEHYGANNKNRKDRWEKSADELIERLGARRHVSIKEIQLVIAE